MKLGNIDFYAGISGLALKLLLVAVLVPAVLVSAACKQKDNSARNTAQSTPAGDTSETQGGNPVVIISTSKGDIKVELFKNEAPITVENFLSYVNDGFYDGTIFHRVIPNFMIQGGGFTPDFVQKETKAPIKNEATNGLKNDRGTLAMARTQAVDSATSQFFINLVGNDFLNNGARDYGYAVFGKVVDGMDVVDAIAAVPTDNKGMHGKVPTEDVVIESVKVVEE
jgi:peptidyl-prolyl cis-trans isomerase A (cyclophilin A)